MYSASLLVPFILLVADLAVATPTPVVGGKLPHKRSACAPPAATTVNVNGQFTVHYSDNVISVGTQDPSTIFQQVGSQCASSGSCDPNTFTAKGQVKGDPEGIEELDISMVAHGLYPPWIHNGLYDALMLAVKQATTVSTETYTPTTVCTTSIGCSGQADKSISIHTVPDWIAVYWYDPDDCNADPAFMGVQTSVKVEGSPGFCSTFATVGGALATLFDNAPSVAAFSLLGLACSQTGQ